MAIEAGGVVLDVLPDADGFARETTRQIGRQSRLFTRVGQTVAGKIGQGFRGVGDDAARTLARDLGGQSGKFNAVGRDIGDEIGGGISDALDDVSARVGTRIGPGFASIGGKLGGAVLGGFAALGIGSVIAGEIGKGMDIEAANDKLAAQLGLTGKQAERAGKLAGQLYSGAWGESIDQVNDAFEGIQGNIGDLSKFSNRQLKSMGAAALDLATILDEDVGRTTRAAGQLMRNNLAKNATEAFNLITRATQEGANASGDLLDTIEEYAPFFDEIGFSGPQALGAVASALRAGARNGDLAADAIKEFSIRAVDGSKLTAEGFKTLGLDAEDMAAAIGKGGPAARKAFTQVLDELGKIRDPIKQEAAGVALFGTQFEDLGIKAILALDPTANKLDKVDGAAKRMGKTLSDNAKTNIESFKRSLSITATNVIGNQLLPKLSDFAVMMKEELGPAIKTAKNAWKDFASLIGSDEDGVPAVSNAVLNHLGVKVPDAVNTTGNSFETLGERVAAAKTDSIKSFRELTDTLSSRSLSWGEKFGIIWSDMWSENSEKEEKNLDRMKGAFDVFRGLLLGDTKAFGRGMRRLFGDTWNDIVDKFRDARTKMSETVQRMTDRIGLEFEQLRRKVAGPVNWVIENVFNRLIGGWNRLNNIWGGRDVGKLGGISLPQFHTGRNVFTGHGGGEVPGNRNIDRDVVPAMLAPGEYVIRKKSVDQVGVDYLEYLNRHGAARLPEGFQRGGLVALGRWFQGKGARVAGHPAFPPIGVHTPGSLHYSGDAIDVNYGPPGSSGTEQRFFDRWIPMVRALGEYREILWRVAGHFNHAHIGGYQRGGGLFGAIAAITRKAAAALARSSIGKFLGGIFERITSRAGGIGGGLLGDGVVGMARTAIGNIRDTAMKKLVEVFFAGGGSAGSGPAVAQVRAVAQGYGWAAGPQWNALSRLIQKESSWNPTAQNPTSTAYGLFQFLNSTWAGTGIAKTSNPRLQAVAGLRYIKRRYGTPIGALAFHNRNNWYRQGGLVEAANGFAGTVTRPTRFLAGEAGPEDVFIAPHRRFAKGGQVGFGPRDLLIRRGIRELLAHIRRGGRIFDDLSFRGMSDRTRGQIDAISKLFYRRYPKFEFGQPGTRKFVEGALMGILHPRAEARLRRIAGRRVPRRLGWAPPEGYVTAARTLLRRVVEGKRFREDFSYRGMGPWVRRWHDEISDRFYRGHRGFEFKWTRRNREVMRKAFRSYLMDSGGWLPPGPSMVLNNTGVAERVLSPAELARFEGAGGRPLEIVYKVGEHEFSRLWIDTGRKVVKNKGGGNVQKVLGRM